MHTNSPSPTRTPTPSSTIPQERRRIETKIGDRHYRLASREDTRFDRYSDDSWYSHSNSQSESETASSDDYYKDTEERLKSLGYVPTL